MGRRSDKTAKIQAAIAKGTPASEIAKKYEVSSAYVYAVRKRMRGTVVAKAQPPRRKPVVKVVAKSVLAPAPVPAPVPEVVPVPVAAHVPLWRQVLDLFSRRPQ